ncbi:MAG TPA: IS110 family transposase [Anaerolineales bacterium]|nr:IS110 family transposase [Anaerolineales bacterium]
MKIYPITRPIQRYIALDIHKEYVLAGGMNASQEWLLAPRKIEMSRFEEWAKRHLCKNDAVVIETTTNVWEIYDIVQPLVGHTVVAHAGGVRQIAEARVKTDKEDVKRLLRLLIADILPEVWVPPQPVRELRGLISYRQRLVKTGAVFRNRLQSLLHSHNLVLPDEGLLSQEWWARQEKISLLEKLQISQEIVLLEQIEKHKAEVDQELAKQSLGATWGRAAVRLMQLPGLGVVIAMTVLAAIGDIHRFADANHLVGYSGLGAGVHDSGQEHIEKRITKSGRKELRWAMIEAAWRAVRMSPYWKEQYEKFFHRMRRESQAIVVVARKLLVAVWHVLSKEETDERASEEDLAYKMLLWSWSLSEEARQGLSYKQFAKYALMRLGVQTDITRFVRGKVPRRIASKEEVLERMTKLGLSC